MAHEDLNREHEIDRSSDRTFGLVFAAAFLVISLLPLLKRQDPRWWALGLAAGFALFALIRPTLLAGLNRLWARLGIAIGKVMSPIALGVLFYGVFTPAAALLRLGGKDPLRLKLDRSATSYWIPREPPGPPPDSMTNQF